MKSQLLNTNVKKSRPFLWFYLDERTYGRERYSLIFSIIYSRGPHSRFHKLSIFFISFSLHSICIQIAFCYIQLFSRLLFQWGSGTKKSIQMAALDNFMVCLIWCIVQWKYKWILYKLYAQKSQHDLVWGFQDSIYR